MADDQQMIELAKLIPEVADHNPQLSGDDEKAKQAVADTLAGKTTISGTENPAAVAGAAKGVLDAANPKPEPEMPNDDLVTLPGGLKHKDTVITSVTIRELTGADEEALAAASRQGNIFHFMDVVLQRGTVRFGQESPDDTPKLLKESLVGDRDAILLAIRRTTFGEEIDMFDWVCPVCSVPTQIKADVSDIPVRKPDLEREFEVPLRHGRRAVVRLANGGDQLAVFDQDDLTTAQRNSILLSRTVRYLDQADGTRQNIVGFSSTITRNLPIKDRQDILSQLASRQPGPRFNELTFRHEACGQEVPLVISIGHLFPGI